MIDAKNPRWGDEHTARNMMLGVVLYDKDDDLITIKTGPNEWTVYSRDPGPLNDTYIDGDRGDEIVGIVDDLGGR